MRFVTVGVLVALGCLSGTTASAHHSGAMYDGRNSITLVGTIKEMNWTNPHAWLELNVPAAGGQTTQWSIEFDPPQRLLQRGFRRSNMKAGDKVSVVVHPLRDGRPAGAFASITFADGKVINR